MFDRPTVFILGAGASQELGFPLGSELRDDIRNFMRLSPDSMGTWRGDCRDLFIHCIQDKLIEETLCIEAAQKIADGLQYFNSIDDYLDHRQDAPSIIKLGKLAVSQLILERERKSALNRVRAPHKLSDVGLSDNWLFKLVRMIVKGVPKSKVDDVFKNLSFITFNYDRSLEQFLTLALAEACDINHERAHSLVANLPIHHVYGSLGGLPGFKQKPYFEYGRTATPRDVIYASEGIRTYTETVADEQEADAVRMAMYKAEKVVFLGCGYHKQNIQILKPEGGIQRRVEVIATGCGLSETNLGIVTDRLGSLFQEGFIDLNHPIEPLNIAIKRMECRQLMDEYSLGLTD